MNNVTLCSQSLQCGPNLASICAVDILTSSFNYQESVAQEHVLPPIVTDYLIG